MISILNKTTLVNIVEYKCLKSYRMREALAIILVTLFGCTIADETRQKSKGCHNIMYSHINLQSILAFLLFSDIGIFNVVKFGNDPCLGIGDKVLL